ncbi:hypothetical protein D3C76_218470 [compost metagenome]
MPRLEIDFGPQRQKSWTSYGFIAIGVLAVAGAIWWRADLLDRREELLQRIERADPGRSMDVVQLDFSGNSAELEISRLASSLRYPWGAVWSAIQQAQGGVVILHLEPSEPQSRDWNITAQAADTQSMLDFLRRLRSMPMWHSVILKSEAQQEASQASDSTGLMFQLVLRWTDDA